MLFQTSEKSESSEVDFSAEFEAPSNPSQLKTSLEGFWKRRFDVFAKKPLDFMKRPSLFRNAPEEEYVTASQSPLQQQQPSNKASALIAKIKPMSRKPQTPASTAPESSFWVLTEKVKAKVINETKKSPNQVQMWEVKSLDFQLKKERLEKLDTIKRGEDSSKKFLTETELKQLCESKQDIVPQNLLDSLFQLQVQDEVENTDEHQVILAKYFPAVIYTLGSERWLFVKGMYLSLANHQSVSFTVILLMD